MTRTTSLGRSVREALIVLAGAQEIDEVLDLGQALRGKLFDLFDQHLFGGHCIGSLGFFLFAAGSLTTKTACRCWVSCRRAWSASMHRCRATAYGSLGKHCPLAPHTRTANLLPRAEAGSAQHASRA